MQQALRGEDVPDFGAADAEGEGAESAVRARVAVAADDRAAGLREAKLGSDDVHDAAQFVAHAEQLDAEFGAVLLELMDLPRRRLDRERCPTEHLLGARGRRMVHCREGQVGAPDLELALPQQLKCLR